MHERDLIQSIAEKAARNHSFLRKGIGDDCAVFNSIPGMEWLVTADMLVENVHFDPSWHAPYLLGRKSIAVNISDIAGMGGLPQFALLSIAIPGHYDSKWTDSYVAGCISLLDQYNCVLIGGDTVSSDKLTIAVTVIGTAPANNAICRDGARAGDAVYVSGPLGSAAAGLHLCQSENYSIADTENCRWQILMGCHLDPTPRVQLAQLLQASGYVTAMQDISDGIATDLSHICTASNVSATIVQQSLPAHHELLAMCRQLQLDPVHFQVRGGEDYELLFTVQSGCEEQLEQRIKTMSGEEIYKIGRISEGQGVTMRTRSGEGVRIDYQGYEHSS